MELDLDFKKRLDRFDLALHCRVEGTRIGVYGPSGSGKSTLAALISGQLTPDSGRIELDGRLLVDTANGSNLPPEKRRVAVVFQQAHLFPHLSVRRNLLYGYRRTEKARRRLSPEEVTAALEIAHLLDRDVGALSGGERQRVALGRALLACPDLLILDEPLSALDQGIKRQIIPFLRKTLRRFAIPYLYISHSLSEMRLLTEKVLTLEGGELAEISDAETIARRRLATSSTGYINHLRLNRPREVGSLLGYRWGESELLLSAHADPRPGIFELSSKDLLLFKNHPQALSARNLLKTTVSGLIPQGGMVAVELECSGERLVAQVAREAALELGMEAGSEVYAAVKASAFRRLV